MDSRAETEETGYLGGERRENEKDKAGGTIEPAGNGSAFEAKVPKMHSFFCLGLRD